MARLMTLCSLPRTNPGDRKEYVRRNGPYTLGMSAGINNKLPYGNIPRLLLAWVCTEAVRTQCRELVLGRLGCGVHAQAGHLQHQRREIHPSPQSDAAALSLPSGVDLHGRTWGAVRCFTRRRSRRVLVEPKAAHRAITVGEQDRAGRGVLPGDHQPPRTD